MVQMAGTDPMWEKNKQPDPEPIKLAIKPSIQCGSGSNDHHDSPDPQDQEYNPPLPPPSTLT